MPKQNNKDRNITLRKLRPRKKAVPPQLTPPEDSDDYISIEEEEEENDEMDEDDNSESEDIETSDCETEDGSFIDDSEADKGNVVFFDNNITFGKTPYMMIPITSENFLDEDESEGTEESLEKKPKTSKEVLANILLNEKLVKEYDDLNMDLSLDLRQQILLLDVNVEIKSSILRKYDFMVNTSSTDSDRSKFMAWTRDVLQLPFNKNTPFHVTMENGPVEIKTYLDNTKDVLDKSVSGHDNAKEEIVDYIARMISNPNGKGNIIALCGDKGTGKCHGKGTMIRMADFTLKAVEEVVIGDELLGDDLTPRTVESICSGWDEMYKINQSNGLPYVVNGVHPLCLKMSSLPSMDYDDRTSSFVLCWLNKFRLAQKVVPIKNINAAYTIWNSLKKVEDTIDMPVNDFLKLSPSVVSQMQGFNASLLHIFWDQLIKVLTPTDEVDHMEITKEDILLGHACGLLFTGPTSVYKSGLSDAIKSNDYKLVSTDVIHSDISITKLGLGQYFGFEISGNHRYVLADGTVTHNTRLIKRGVAAALERPFHVINMGGLTDASVLTGHSSTYVGATYGRISEILISSKVNNPIIYLDELDKVQSDNRERGSEVYKVLLSLLDEEQASEFHDAYFGGIKIDLSKVLWVVSMNTIETVDPILLDRLKIINIKPLDIEKKVEIVSKYILPELMDMVGMELKDISIPDTTIRHVISKTNEQGCRQLKKKIETIIQKLNTQRITGTGIYLEAVDSSVLVTSELADKCLKSNELGTTSFYNMYT